MKNPNKEAHGSHMVYCLSIDLIGSTKAGFQLSSKKLDSFNKALVQQIESHVEQLELSDISVKFTGDGWLFITPKADEVSRLCCLATIMSHNFQTEMSVTTGIEPLRIPGLRLAICSGRDLRVELFDGSRDWLGDSARRATRASGYCYENEILVDEPVRYLIFRDFHIADAKIDQRPPEYQPKKSEENFTL